MRSLWDRTRAAAARRLREGGWWPPLLRYAVEGTSMAPTLEAGDWLLAVGPRWLALGRGRPGVGRGIRPEAIVSARRPDRPALTVIKRAASGGTDPGGVFLLGDNPDCSTDSRHWGPLRAADVEGVVVLRYWPPRRIRRFQP